MFGSFLAPRLMDDWGGDDSGGSSSSSSSSGSRSSSGWKKSRAASGVRAAGQSLSASGNQMMSDSRDDAASRIGAVSYRKGGKTRKDGVANLHKNERVIPASKRKKVERLMKRNGMSLTNKKRGNKARSSGR
jgi:hypothetical protein